MLLPSLIPGLSYHLAIIISVAFFGIMAFAGGFLAVSTTNVINALAIIIGIALCAIMGVYQTGGLGGVAASLPVTHNYMSLVEGMSPVIIVAWLLSMIVQGCAGQTEWTTAASAKSAKHARRGFIWGGVAQLPLGLLVGLIGLVAIIRFPGLETSDSALTTVASSINPIIGILALAAIWAANASSAQAFIIAAASVLTGGVRRYSKKKLTDKQEFTLSKVLVLVTTLLAYLISMLAQDIISWSINLSAIMTPFSILLICTIYAPKVLRKNTFLLLFVFCIASILLFVLIPAFAATFQHIVYPLLISTGLAFVLGLIFDRRHSITPENALAASK